MRSLLLLLALVACTKDGPKKDPETGASPAPAERPAPGTPPPRSGAIPQLRTAPRQAPSNLPPEANPPGAPVLTGPIQVDRDVRYIDEKIGNGDLPAKGKPVSVHYTGWLVDGSKFDSSVDRGDPINIKFDSGMVIKGWDIGLASMRVGGKRRLIIPADLAYGDRDTGPIPPGSILVFDVELVEAEN